MRKSRLTPCRSVEDGWPTKSVIEQLVNCSFNDYFAENPTKSPHEFCRRFRMKREVFRRIVHGVREYDDYFELKKDCTGLLGISSLQKCTAAIAIWCLTDGVTAYSLDDYLCMSEFIVVEATYRFCKAVVKVWRDISERTKCGRHSSSQGTRPSKRISGDAWEHYCMHWNWKSCSLAWQNLYVRTSWSMQCDT